jgi:iron(III) transport system ATP-binding protein
MTTAPGTLSGDGGHGRQPPTGAAVSITGLTVTFDQPTGPALDAVRDATLEIEPGSMVALLGPSGCGKTSLLRAIAGLERPTAGSVTIGGRVVSDTPVRGGGIWVHPERRNVGMVFQDGALFPHLTVADNIAFGLKSERRKESRTKRQQRVAEMLNLVDLVDFADRLPGTLSGGQQQRVALARSLAPQPSVLLLDEPFSALDTALRIQVRAEVSRIVSEVGVTTIFVTHDQDEAFVLGDKVAVLRNGRIKQVGTPDALYRHPKTRWIAGFVGEANFIQGSIDIGTPTHATTALGPVPITDSQQITDQVDDDVDLIPVQVLVRPEQAVIEADPSGAPIDGGHIGAVEYYGHDIRYDVLLDDGTGIAARTQSPELFEVGQRVRIRFEGHPTKAWPTSPRR